MGKLEDYIRALEAHQYAPPRQLSATPNQRLRWIPTTLRGRIKELATGLIKPFSWRRARRLVRQTDTVRLHLGCGGRLLDGWINVDLVGQPADLPWDVRNRLPFSDGSVTAVFHEHLLEHLPITAAMPLLRESRRVLRTNGILRIGVPDFERYVRGYLQSDGFLEANVPNRPTSLLAVAEVVYGYRHLWVWDGQTLCLALEEAGFVEVSVRPFGNSAIQPPPDGLHRVAETVYVEGRRP